MIFTVSSVHFPDYTHTSYLYSTTYNSNLQRSHRIRDTIQANRCIIGNFVFLVFRSGLLLTHISKLSTRGAAHDEKRGKGFVSLTLPCSRTDTFSEALGFGAGFDLRAGILFKVRLV